MRNFLWFLFGCPTPTDSDPIETDSDPPIVTDSQHDTDLPVDTDPVDTDLPIETDIPIDTDLPTDHDEDGVASDLDCNDNDDSVWENGELDHDLQVGNENPCFGYCSLAVDGFVRVYDTERTDLDDLACIHSIDGPLYIYHNENLSDMSGLSQLYEVTGDIQVRYNSDLSEVEFAQLPTIGGYLWVTDNAALDQLDGLEAITSIGGDLEIRNNLTLPDLAGLESLITIGGSLKIQGNTLLSDAASLGALESIGGDVTICNNPDLDEVALQTVINEIDIGGTITVSESCP